MSTIKRFRGDQLFRKFGFEDGEAFDKIMTDAGYDPMASHQSDDTSPFFGSAVLASLVRQKMAELLPHIPVRTDMSISHNPVRVSEDDVTEMERETIANLAFEASTDEIIAAAEVLAPAFPGARLSNGVTPR